MPMRGWGVGWWWEASTNYWFCKTGRRSRAQICCMCFCLFQWYYYFLVVHINPPRPSPILYVLAKSTVNIECDSALWDSKAVSTTMEVTWNVMQFGKWAPPFWTSLCFPSLAQMMTTMHKFLSQSTDSTHDFTCNIHFTKKLSHFSHWCPAHSNIVYDKHYDQ